MLIAFDCGYRRDLINFISAVHRRTTDAGAYIVALLLFIILALLTLLCDHWTPGMCLSV
jgi:hypothetical protein